MKRLRKPLRIAAYLLFVFVITEIAVRAYWGAIGGSFMDAPNRMHMRWFPELKQLEPRRSDKEFDVLLLGGSVLDNLAGRIRFALDEVLDVPARVA